MTIAWTAVLVIGFTVALLASRRAVIHASALAIGSRILLAVRGSLFAMAALAAVTLLLTFVRRHDWKTGLALLGIYAAMYLALLA